MTRGFNTGGGGWSLNPADLTKYKTIFQQNTGGGEQVLSSDKAKSVFVQSKLEPTELFTIWNMVDPNQAGHLTVDQFSAAMHLIFGRLSGKPLPTTLPTELNYLIPNQNHHPTSNTSNSGFNQNYSPGPTSNSGFNQNNYSPGPTSNSGFNQNNNNNSRQPSSNVDPATLQTLENEVMRKRTLVSQLPPSLPPVSDQELTSLKTRVETLYPKVPYHHPNFFSYLSEHPTTGKSGPSPSTVASLKADIDKLFDHTFDTTLSDLATQIAQCQVELFKLEDSIQHGYTLPTKTSTPVLPQMDPSGDPIAQKAAAMLAQRMQQLSLATPAQTIPADAQNRIQEREAQVQRDGEAQKTRADQLLASMTQLRKDFNSLVDGLTQEAPDTTDLQELASEWQNGDQRASYRVGRLVEDLASKGKAMEFPSPEVKPSQVDPKPDPSSPPSSTTREPFNSSGSPPSSAGQDPSTRNAKDLIKQFSQVESNNDPFAALVSSKSKPKDLFADLIQSKESTEPQGSSQSTTSDSSKPQPEFDPFTVKDSSSKPTSGSGQVPPPPPPPPMPTSQGSTSKFSSNHDDQPIWPKPSSPELKPPSERDASPARSPAALSDNNPFARLSATSSVPPATAESPSALRDNNPFGKPPTTQADVLPPGVKFAVSALYAYEEPEASLTFQAGDILHVTDDGDDPEGEWYLGHLPDHPDAEDWFPRSFVAPLDESVPAQPDAATTPDPTSVFAHPEPPLPDEHQPEESIPDEPTPAPVDHDDPASSSPPWRLVYDFTPEDTDNLDLIPADTIVTLLEDTDPDWWLIVDPRPDAPEEAQLYVPANFLAQEG